MFVQKLKYSHLYSKEHSIRYQKQKQNGIYRIACRYISCMYVQTLNTYILHKYIKIYIHTYIDIYRFHTKTSQRRAEHQS